MALDFPPVEEASEEGFIGVGGELTLDNLTAAYQRGIFPWPVEGIDEMPWFSPDPRGILFYDNLYVNRTLRKFLAKCPYEVKFNHDFLSLIVACSQHWTNRGGTWITDKIIHGYADLFKNNHAYSVEIYNDCKLVGGMYGVKFGHYYSGESMFSTAPNASKVAIWSLMNRLHEAGINWIDTQIVTDASGQMGAIEVARKEFIEHLKKEFYKETISRSNFP